MKPLVHLSDFSQAICNVIFRLVEAIHDFVVDCALHFRYVSCSYTKSDIDLSDRLPVLSHATTELCELLILSVYRVAHSSHFNLNIIEDGKEVLLRLLKVLVRYVHGFIHSLDIV